MYFPAREAGVDPGVRWSRRHRPGGCRFCHLCREEGGVQKQVSWRRICAAGDAFSMSRPLWFNVALYRTPAYRFSNLRIQDDDNGVTMDLASAISSDGTACHQDSDDVRAI